jgi:large subunit ribosomal protein L11
MQFCKEFNARTQAQAGEGLTIPVIITVYADRSFTFITKTPPASVLIKKAIGLHLTRSPPRAPRSRARSRSARSPGISQEDRGAKINDLNCYDVEAGARSIIAGTARSMGVDVV